MLTSLVAPNSVLNTVQYVDLFCSSFTSQHYTVCMLTTLVVLITVLNTVNPTTLILHCRRPALSARCEQCERVDWFSCEKHPQEETTGQADRRLILMSQ